MIDGIVRRQGSSFFALFVLTQFLLLATFVLTAPSARAAAAGTIMVTSTADDGTAVVANCPGPGCRLRDAVAKAVSGDTIAFDSVVFSIPVTITLVGSEIGINGDLVNRTFAIDGSAAPVMPTISGPGANCIPATPSTCFRVFYVWAGNVTINRLRIVNGRALGAPGGGGILNGGTLTVTNSAFSSNGASGSVSANGGAITSLTDMTLLGDTFSANTAAGNGGAVDGQTLTVTNSIFSDNTASSYAGGLIGWKGLLMMNSVFSGNTAAMYGGGLASNNCCNPSPVAITNSLFYSNTASSGAGGIYLMSGVMTVTNSTLVNNYAGDTGYGGAINTFPGTTLTLVNSTLANNRSGKGAGGIQKSGTATVKNTIIAKGTLGSNCIGTLGIDSTNNYGDDLSCGSSFTRPTSLLLGTLGNYGGSTETIPLLPNSPAIDAGHAAACPATDQRGIARPQPSAGACDVGAFESQGFRFTSQTGTPQSAPPNTAFARPLGLTVVPTGTLEPINGGQVVFTAPSGSGVASIASSFITATISAGHVSQPVTANGILGGPYDVIASARGAAPNVYFALTNTDIRKVFLPFIRR